MLPNHSILKRLPQGQDTQAMFARAPTGKLIVFVHGFGGASISTWKEMHQLLPLEAQAAGWDIVFYGYRSTRGRAQPNADLLRQFISKFTESRSANAPNLVRRNANQDVVVYSEILIVAHSLGAPIARRAVLDAIMKGDEWPASCRLLLFAPAHRGAHLLQLSVELMSTGVFLAVIAALGQAAVPMLTDLIPNSNFLRVLHDETIARIGGAPRPPLIADTIVLAEFDNVVEMLRFGEDPGSHTEATQTHMSVCKATTVYQFPLREVVRLL